MYKLLATVAIAALLCLCATPHAKNTEQYSVNVYKTNKSGKLIYTKYINLGDLKGKYRIRIFVNGIVKRNFVVNLS